MVIVVDSHSCPGVAFDMGTILQWMFAPLNELWWCWHHGNQVLLPLWCHNIHPVPETCCMDPRAGHRALLLLWGIQGWLLRWMLLPLWLVASFSTILTDGLEDSNFQCLCQWCALLAKLSIHSLLVCVLGMLEVLTWWWRGLCDPSLGHVDNAFHESSGPSGAFLSHHQQLGLLLSSGSWTAMSGSICCWKWWWKHEAWSSFLWHLFIWLL